MPKTRQPKVPKTELTFEIVVAMQLWDWGMLIRLRTNTDMRYRCAQSATSSRDRKQARCLTERTSDVPGIVESGRRLNLH